MADLKEMGLGTPRHGQFSVFKIVTVTIPAGGMISNWTDKGYYSNVGIFPANPITSPAWYTQVSPQTSNQTIIRAGTYYGVDYYYYKQPICGGARTIRVRTDYAEAADRVFTLIFWG